MEREPEVDFDHHSEEFAADPDAQWRRLRQTCPIAWSDHYGGFWVVSDMQGNHEVLKQHEIFTTLPIPSPLEGSPLTIPKNPDPYGYRTLPIEVDPPEHGPLRRLLNVVMSPAASEAMQPRIEHWVSTHIDAVIAAGRCDLVYDIASPVPAFITLEWLGFPLEHAKLASEAFHDLLGYPPDHEKLIAAAENRGRVALILEETVAARRREPREDIISYFAQQPVDGELLDDRTIVEMCLTLIGGGVDSTTSLTSNALVHLNRDRELRQRLIDEPELLVPATEEFLRTYAPFGTIARTVREDTSLRGCPMHPGDRVLVSRHSANYDETAFERADDFVPDRFPNRHVSFGLGVHRCSGSHLARLMFREMVTQILTRMPDYDLDEGAMQRYPDRGFVHGWLTLPARFTPAPAATAAAGDRSAAS